MKKATVSVQLDLEKLKALQYYISKKDSTIEAELNDFMIKLYEKYVPVQTREYIENRPERSERPRSRASQPARPARIDPSDKPNSAPPSPDPPT